MERIANCIVAFDDATDEWLAARFMGVTATHAKQLMLNDIESEAIVKATAFAKHLDTPYVEATDRPEPSNRYFAWGKKREPLIAKQINEQHPTMMHESRLYISEDDHRIMASPDMIDTSGDKPVLAEIKTTSRKIALSDSGFTSTGYNLQMQWQMHCIGADECLYVVEQHNNDWQWCGARHTEPTGIIRTTFDTVEADNALQWQMRAESLKFMNIYNEWLGSLGVLDRLGFDTIDKPDIDIERFVARVVEERKANGR